MDGQIKMIDKEQRAGQHQSCMMFINNEPVSPTYSFTVFLTDCETKVASVVNAKKVPWLCLCSFKINKELLSLSKKFIYIYLYLVQTTQAFWHVLILTSDYTIILLYSPLIIKQGMKH